jgi:hypothetical protein
LKQVLRSYIVHHMNDFFEKVHDSGNGRPAQGGPSLVLVSGLSLGFLIGGLVVSAALGGVVPSPFKSAAEVQGYFRDHPAAVQAGAIAQFASAVPLLVYASAASARLRQLGVTAPGATIALAGGTVASAALGLSGLLQWTLSRPDVSADTAVVRATSTLVFLVGGPWHVVALGLLVAGVAVPSLIIRLLPRPVAWAGLVIAVVAELSTLSLVTPDLAVLVPMGRFAGLIWLVVAGALLPRRRRTGVTGWRSKAAASRIGGTTEPTPQ